MIFKPAIVVVAYNRQEALARLLSSINKAYYPGEDITLIISIDYAETNQDVVEYAEQFCWNYGTKIVKTHTKNMGLKEHILECGDYALKYGAVIILEDDCLVAPAFYSYICDAQAFYYDDENVAGISSYAYEWNGYACQKFLPLQIEGDVYFGQFACSLGQSWTDRQWKEFRKWYETNPKLVDDGRMPDRIYNWKHSWSKYFTAYIVEKGKYFVVPYKATTVVFGEVGTHAKTRYLEHQVALYLGNERFKMVKFEKGVHYDIFFENVDLKKAIKQQALLQGSEDVCIDIYACRELEFVSSRYLLTTRKLNKRIIQSYALDMRPQEINVFMDVKGDDIFLYDMKVDEINKIYKKKNRIMYDMAGVRPRVALYYGLYKGIEEWINTKRR